MPVSLLWDWIGVLNSWWASVMRSSCNRIIGRWLLLRRQNPNTCSRCRRLCNSCLRQCLLVPIHVAVGGFRINIVEAVAPGWWQLLLLLLLWVAGIVAGHLYRLLLRPTRMLGALHDDTHHRDEEDKNDENDCNCSSSSIPHGGRNRWKKFTFYMQPSCMCMPLTISMQLEKPLYLITCSS